MELPVVAMKVDQMIRSFQGGVPHLPMLGLEVDMFHPTFICVCAAEMIRPKISINASVKARFVRSCLAQRILDFI